MKNNRKPIYVLETGLSHDGSACLLKDGVICAAIEKERVTRRKHDGGNDTDAINYCLAVEIEMEETDFHRMLADIENERVRLARAGKIGIEGNPADVANLVRILRLIV